MFGGNPSGIRVVPVGERPCGGPVGLTLDDVSAINAYMVEAKSCGERGLALRKLAHEQRDLSLKNAGDAERFFKRAQELQDLANAIYLDAFGVAEIV